MIEDEAASSSRRVAVKEIHLGTACGEIEALRAIEPDRRICGIHIAARVERRRGRCRNYL